MEAGLPTLLNFYESQYKANQFEHLLSDSVNSTWKITGTFYPNGFEIRDILPIKISNKQYLISKYTITKGYRIFPRKVTRYAKETEVTVKKVKVKGVSIRLLNLKTLMMHSQCIEKSGSFITAVNCRRKSKKLLSDKFTNCTSLW